MTSDERAVGAAENGTGPYGTVLLQGLWTPRAPGVGAIDLRRLGAYRFPHEVMAMVVAIVTMVAAAAAGSILISPKVAIGLVGLIVFQGIIVPLRVRAMVGRSAEITPAQFASLYPVVRRNLERLDMPPTRVFVTQDPTPYAFSFGLTRPYGIVLTSSLVEGLTRDELAAVIAHEMGHIKFGHVRVNQLFGGANVQLGIPLVEFLIRVPFLWWMRCAELSADRVAYAATERVSTMISGLVKMTIGPKLYDEVRPDELARQGQEFARSPWAPITQMKSNTPFLMSRIQNIIDFAGPPESDHQLNLARPDGLELDRDRAATQFGGGPSPARPPAAADLLGSSPPADHGATLSGSVRTGRIVGPPSGPPFAQPTSPPPAPAVARPDAWLAVSQGADGLRWFRVPGPWVTVGRGPENDLVIPDGRISHRHFGLKWASGSYVLSDLNSRNGTLLNGRPIRDAVIGDGDEIVAGDAHFRFTLAR